MEQEPKKPGIMLPILIVGMSGFDTGLYASRGEWLPCVAWAVSTVIWMVVVFSRINVRRRRS